MEWKREGNKEFKFSSGNEPPFPTMPTINYFILLLFIIIKHISECAQSCLNSSFPTLLSFLELRFDSCSHLNFYAHGFPSHFIIIIWIRTIMLYRSVFIIGLGRVHTYKFSSSLITMSTMRWLNAICLVFCKYLMFEINRCDGVRCDTAVMWLPPPPVDGPPLPSVTRWRVCSTFPVRNLLFSITIILFSYDYWYYYLSWMINWRIFT